MIINSSNEIQVVPKGNLYPRFREEERLKVKKNVSSQLRNQEMRKSKFIAEQLSRKGRVKENSPSKGEMTIKR